MNRITIKTDRATYYTEQVGFFEDDNGMMLVVNNTFIPRQNVEKITWNDGEYKTIREFFNDYFIPPQNCKKCENFVRAYKTCMQEQAMTADFKPIEKCYFYKE